MSRGTEEIAKYLFWEARPQADWSMAIDQDYFLAKAERLIKFLQSQGLLLDLEGYFPHRVWYRDAGGWLCSSGFSLRKS